MATVKPFILKADRDSLSPQSRFVDILTLSREAQACRHLNAIFKVPLEKAKIARELLDLVLNIDEDKKKRILEIIRSNPEYILYRTKGSVKYYSTNQKKIVGRIEIDNVSPLEAAALSGDFHLVNYFRDALPNRLKHEAGTQLEAIMSRPDFLSACYELQKAYHTCLRECNKPAAKDWKTIEDLWEQVGEARKKLSTYGLQVFCNPVPNKPCPDFTIEPVRACRFEVYDEANGWKVVDGDLDSFGLGTESNLVKSGPRGVRRRKWGACCLSWELVLADSMMHDFLCKEIPEQLGKTKTLLLQYKPGSNQEPELEEHAASVEPDPDKDQASARPG